MATISQFKRAYRNPARSNKFEVYMGFPLGIAGADTLRDFPLLCKAAQLPSSTLGIIEIPYQGRIVKIAGDRTFEEWTVTISNDENFRIHNAMTAWMDGINSHEGNFKSLTNPYGTATVFQLSGNNLPIKEYRFVDIFPTNVAAIELDMSSNDQLQEFQVTFAYDYWTSSETT